MATAVEEPDIRNWRVVFNQYDDDRDGVIPLKELRYMLERNAENEQVMEDFPSRVTTEIMEWYEIDNDGVLTIDEYLRMIHTDQLVTLYPGIRSGIYYIAVFFVPKNQREITIRQFIEDNHCMPSIVLLLLTLMQLFIHVNYSLTFYQDSTSWGPIPTDNLFIANPYKRHELWRYFTYFFIHTSDFQMLFNVYVQFTVGMPLEMIHRWKRVMLIYLSGNLAGSLLTPIFEPNAFISGGTGGSYALLAAFAVSVLTNVRQMKCCLGYLLFIIPNLIFDIHIGMDAGDFKERISSVPRIAGILTGVLLSKQCIPNLQVSEREHMIGRGLMYIFLEVLLIAVLYNGVLTFYHKPK